MNKRKIFIVLGIVIIIILIVTFKIVVNAKVAQVTSDEYTLKQAMVESKTITNELTNSMEISSRINRKSRVTCYLLF